MYRQFTTHLQLNFKLMPAILLILPPFTLPDAFMVVCGARHTAGVISSDCMVFDFKYWSESCCMVYSRASALQEHALARTMRGLLSERGNSCLP